MTNYLDTVTAAVLSMQAAESNAYVHMLAEDRAVLKANLAAKITLLKGQLCGLSVSCTEAAVSVYNNAEGFRHAGQQADAAWRALDYAYQALEVGLA